MQLKQFVRIGSMGLTLVLALCLAFPLRASAALDFSGYFSLSINSSLGQTNLYAGTSISPTVTGIATCEADLPFTVSAATVTGQIVAIGPNNATVVLNPVYTVSIGSFPVKKGQSVQESQIVELSFPGNIAPGQYDIVGIVSQAQVQIVLWFNVTSYVPSSMFLGTVTVLGAPVPTPGPIPTPTPEPIVTPAPTLTPAPVVTTTEPPPTATTETPAPSMEPTVTPRPTTPSEPAKSPTAEPTAQTPTTTSKPPSTIPSTIVTGPIQTPAPTTTTLTEPTPAQPIASDPLASTTKPAAIPAVSLTSDPPAAGFTSAPWDYSPTSWIVFPLSVGGLTLLLVILAFVRTPRAGLKKEDYTFNLPPES